VSPRAAALPGTQFAPISAAGPAQLASVRAFAPRALPILPQ
jgi:hypothetical protein